MGSRDLLPCQYSFVEIDFFCWYFLIFIDLLFQSQKLGTNVEITSYKKEIECMRKEMQIVSSPEDKIILPLCIYMLTLRLESPGFDP